MECNTTKARSNSAIFTIVCAYRFGEANSRSRGRERCIDRVGSLNLGGACGVSLNIFYIFGETGRGSFFVFRTFCFIYVRECEAIA